MLLATEVGAVENPVDSSDEYELPYEWPYGDEGDASATQDMDAFPGPLRLCERDLVRPARLGDEPMRCRPLRSRWRLLSLGRSMMVMASVEEGVERLAGAMSVGVETTTESMDGCSMVLVGGWPVVWTWEWPGRFG